MGVLLIIYIPMFSSKPKDGPGSLFNTWLDTYTVELNELRASRGGRKNPKRTKIKCTRKRVKHVNTKRVHS